MTPTNKLRFVEREIPIPMDMIFSRVEKVSVLQQWFDAWPDGEGEWRDVPLEVEE